MKKGVLPLIALSLIAVFILVSCKSEETAVEQEVIPEEIQTSLGVPFDELRSDVSEFVLKTYMPSEQNTKEDYVSSILKYLSENEYNSLISDIGDYYGDIKTNIENLKIQYGVGENNSDSDDKILVSFYLHKEANGTHVRNRINLMFTIKNGKIIHHAIYEGATEKRSD